MGIYICPECGMTKKSNKDRGTKIQCLCNTFMVFHPNPEPEKKISDIVYKYFGVGWNKNPERSVEIRKNFDDCAKEVIEFLRVLYPRMIQSKSEIFVCSKCNGEKTIEDLNVPSPKIGGGYYRPDCPLCDTKGYIIHREED